jgi:drug/metabolite transporter (DMT)-like permease
VAQTRKRRRRKHRGTQGGSIDRRGRASRPRSRQEARARTRKQLGQKREGPPTWRSAVNRGLLGAGIFLVLLILLFRQPVASSVALSALMLALYIPLGYYMERFFYNRRQAAKQRQRAAKDE